MYGNSAQLREDGNFPRWPWHERLDIRNDVAIGWRVDERFRRAAVDCEGRDLLLQAQQVGCACPVEGSDQQPRFELPVQMIECTLGLVASHSCLCQHLQVFVRRLLDGDTDKQDRPALEFAWRLVLTANGIAAVEPDTEPVTR